MDTDYQRNQGDPDETQQTAVAPLNVCSQSVGFYGNHGLVPAALCTCLETVIAELLVHCWSQLGSWVPMATRKQLTIIMI